MYKKLYPTLVAFLATASVTFAQAPERSCASMEVLERQLQQDPTYRDRLEQLEKHTRQFAETEATQKTAAVITIPVVVHVVWRTSAENISDATIQNQINVLNQDFRKMNPDASLIPSHFAGVAADAQIEFCLAKRDPAGNPTTGIVRRQTTVTSFSQNDAVKYTAQGGSNAWPAGQYLNLWFCNLGGGLLGYAQFPGGAAATDGVVCTYTSVPGGSAPFNKGRTATHEVGHWLNLRHIWGDATCGSDLVSDTPTHNTANTGCPSSSHRSTCSGTPLEMWMNYMDYTDDACMYMFSAGQSTRMNAVLASGGSRYSLTSSLGCVPPSTSTTCGVPAGLSSSSVTASSATLSWGAVSGSGSYNVRFKPTSGTTWTSGNIAGTSANATGLTAATTYEFQVQAVCGSTTSAYSTSATFTTPSSGGGTGGTITLGNGTSTVGTHPYGTYYMDERMQYIVTSAELAAAGYTGGSSLTALAFDVASRSTQVMNGYTIKIAHTTASSFGSTSYLAGSNTTTVYSANYTAATGWNTHTFSTPFTYNGSSNLLIDICFNNSSYTSNSTVRYTNNAAYRTLYRQQDVTSGGICATTTGTRSYSRPNMRLTFASGAREETQTLELASEKLQLYPNPAAQQLSLAYEMAEAGEVTIEVYNTLGQLIYSQHLGQQTAGEHNYHLNLNQTKELSNLPNGLYLFSLIRNGNPQTERFILSR